MIFPKLNLMFIDICLWYQKLIPPPHDRMQELVHVIEGLDLDILQHVVGKAVLKHGLELIPTKPRGIQYVEQKRT